MKITTIEQLNQLMNSTYIYAVVVALVATLIAVAVAFMFPWESNPDRSYVKRRIAYVVIGLVAVFGFWIYNDTEVMDRIQGAGLRNMFKACNLKCIGISTAVYLIASIVLMFTFRHSKFGSILPKRFKK
jgi:FtsH-binding integral membrane protein